MKFLNKALNLLFTLLVVLAVFLAYGSLDNSWYRVVTVEGDSMAPTLRIGDLMVVTKVRQEPIPANTIVVMRISGALVTHRLIGYDERNHPITKGDNNEDIDVFTNPDLTIVGICRARLPGLGLPLLYLARALGRG